MTPFAGALFFWVEGNDTAMESAESCLDAAH